MGVDLELEVCEVEPDLSRPLHAQVESGSRVLEAREQRLFEAVVHLLHVQHALANREEGLDEHSLVPLSLATNLEIGRVAFSGVEATVGQHDHLGLKALDKAPEDGVVAVGATATYAHDLPELIEQQKHLLSHDPAPVALALAGAVPLTTPFSPGMQQFNPKGVAHTQRGRLGQEPLGEVPILLPQAEQARLFGQMREQGAQLFGEPPVERAPALAAQHLKHAQRHDLAWIKMS